MHTQNIREFLQVLTKCQNLMQQEEKCFTGLAVPQVELEEAAGWKELRGSLLRILPLQCEPELTRKDGLIYGRKNKTK